MFYASTCNWDYACRWCSCIAICWLRGLIEAVIQLIAHSDFTKSQCDCMHKVHHIASQHAPHVQYMVDVSVHIMTMSLSIYVCMYIYI